MPAKRSKPAAKRPKSTSRRQSQATTSKAKVAGTAKAKPAKAPARGAKQDNQSGDAWLRELGGWHAGTLGAMRALIRGAEPGIVEEVKWRKPSNGMRGVLTWSHGGLVCTGEPYKDKVKLTFAKGAALPDPAGLFDADDKGATRRAIDLREGQSVDAEAFQQLVQAAVALHAE